MILLYDIFDCVPEKYEYLRPANGGIVLKNFIRHPTLAAVAAVMMYNAWRTSCLVWQLQVLYGVSGVRLWFFTLLVAIMIVGSIKIVVEDMGWIFDLVPGRRAKAAFALPVVALLVVVQKCLAQKYLGHFAFWLLSWNPWAGSSDGFLELQVNTTEAIAMAFAIVAMTFVLPYYAELVRLAVWHDIPALWLTPRRSIWRDLAAKRLPRLTTRWRQHRRQLQATR